MILLLVSTLITVVITLTFFIYLRQLNKWNKNNIPGPPIYPIFGNALQFGFKPEDIFLNLLNWTNKYGKLWQAWIGPNTCFFICSDPSIIEKIMVSSTNINKSKAAYQTLEPWLGDGLLLSAGTKWRKRRKLLTPAFHFNILEDSLQIFNSASDILIQKLRKFEGQEAFNIYPLITLFGLDVIAESAMGIKINAQTESDSEYVMAVREACNCIFKRIFSAFEQPDFLFYYFTTNGRLFKKLLKILHATTDRVIQERRQKLIENISKEQKTDEETCDIGSKKPKTFLDVLLQSSIDGKPLTNLDIREEVDTFMFEGHDTVSSGLSFTLYLLANHPEIQMKAFNEIKEILGEDLKTRPTTSDLNNMQYLELVIKESMRIYPPVPMIGRTLVEPVQIGSTVLPENTTMTLVLYQMHHDSDNFSNPNEFRPERFLDKSIEKNYFSYLPFSAGARNCIGQKFAMYEMKSTIAKILRNFELLPAPSKYDPKIVAAIITKSTNGIHIKLKSRIYKN